MSKKKGTGGRFSARRKQGAVIRLLRGEDLETLSRDLGVTAGTVRPWRQRFLAGGQALCTVVVAMNEMKRSPASRPRSVI